MLNINFNLSSPRDKNRPVPIVAMMRYSGNTVKMSTGQKVLPSNWNKKKQKAKGEGADTVNYNLSKFVTVAREAYRELAKDGVPGKAELRDRVRAGYRGEGRKDSKVSFAEYMDGYIRRKEKVLAPTSMKVYGNARNLYGEFCKSKKKAYCFAGMDVRFAREFVDFVLGRGCAPNYAKRMLNTVRKLLREAHKEGVTQETHYASEFFRAETGNPTRESVYLNEKELRLLYELELERDSKLDCVRDIFLIGCHTGLRVSDYKRLLEENIYVLPNGRRAFRVRAKKTKGDVRIPIRPAVEAILEKRDGRLPMRYSEQEINRSLKKLAEMAGIDEKVTQTTYPGNKPTVTVRRKYELVSSHTARRSFATNAVLDGVPYHWIMKITGHKSVDSFEKYVRMDSEEAALLLSEHRFFMQPAMRVAK